MYLVTSILFADSLSGYLESAFVIFMTEFITDKKRETRDGRLT